MRPNKRADRAMDALALMLKASGVTTEAITEMRETAPTGREAISRQGDAVLLFLECPAKFTAKLCKRCGEPFGTNYRSVAYCGDNCRSKEISTQIGVKWDWLRATEEERWGGEPPLIIPPAALRKIQQFVQWYADNLSTQTEIENPSPIEVLNPLVASSVKLDREREKWLLHEQVLAHTSPPQSLLELSLELYPEEASLFDF